MIKTIGVRFEAVAGTSAMVYSYLTDIEDINVGDYVVVDTNNSGLKLVKVVTLEPEVTIVPKKFIVCKIDLTAHNARIAKSKALEVLKKQMDDRRTKLEEMEIYELLASKDKGMKALLKEYNELLKGE